MESFRKTTQTLMPAQSSAPAPGEYNIYPGFPLEEGKISSGYRELASQLISSSVVILDGYPGVLWENFRQLLTKELVALGVRSAWQDISVAMLPPSEVEALIAPYL